MKKAIMSVLTVWIVVNVRLISLLMISPEIEMQVSATTIIVDDNGTPGVDCNYTTIQEGIDAANPGDNVFVKNGTYYENVIVDKTLNLTGESRDGTIIDGGGTGEVINVDAHWVNITGFTLTNSGSAHPNSGVMVIQVDNCTIYDTNVSQNNYYGIFLGDSSNNIIMNNKIQSNKDDGIHVYLSHNNSISNNNITNNTL